MNSLVELSTIFFDSGNEHAGSSSPILPNGCFVSIDKIQFLINCLEEIAKNKAMFALIGGGLVAAKYKEVVAKSNRIKYIFSDHSRSPNEFICGAKYIYDIEGESKVQKHEFVYFVSRESIENTIQNLYEAKFIIEDLFGDKITDDNLKNLNKIWLRVKSNKLARSRFSQLIVDVYYIEAFYLPEPSKEFLEGNDSLVSFYDTNKNIQSIMQKIGIVGQKLDDLTLRLNPKDINLLKIKAPYLISMAVHDISKVDFLESFKDVSRINKSIPQIPHPSNEPIIGVIDTDFNDNVYFKEYVQVEAYNSKLQDILDEENSKNLDKIKEHGTNVTSIIVDGPSLNPNLDDGCGRFKVKFFKISLGGVISSYYTIKVLEEAIINNPEIKVWNISLGSISEVHKDFISPEAAVLDRLQKEHDVLFIVSATNASNQNNKNRINIKDNHSLRIGAPADSINSIVVSSVDFNGKIAPYCRKGPVLSFFHKPDCSYYGGTKESPLVVCCGDYLSSAYGTSFSAPWIARKAAYLIDVLGFSKEIAKALIIDSSFGWTGGKNQDPIDLIGYGVVPVKIDDIVNCKDDEIRFVIQGVASNYNTYFYDIPIPTDLNGKYPYFARATITYFPTCSRAQGVDYTLTELDLHFGIVTNKDKNNTNSPCTIKPLNGNKQCETGTYDYKENTVRTLFRKWDSVKIISDEVKVNSKPRMKYAKGTWGVKVISKNRLSSTDRELLPFAVVATLKEMKGVNRINSFVSQCAMNGIMVKKIDIKQRVKTYNTLSEEIDIE